MSSVTISSGCAKISESRWQPCVTIVFTNAQGAVRTRKVKMKGLVHTMPEKAKAAADLVLEQIYKETIESGE